MNPLLPLSWIIAVALGAWLGWLLRDIFDLTSKLERAINNLRRGGAHAEEQPTGSVIEPGDDDPVAEARREFDAIQNKLNKK